MAWNGWTRGLDAGQPGQPASFSNPNQYTPRYDFSQWGVQSNPLPEPVLQRMPQDGIAAEGFSPGDGQPGQLHSRSSSLGTLSSLSGGCNASRVPLPAQSAASTEPSPPRGPMSSTVVIPPRPRPGRKPIAQEDAADRRRMQNRVAQRNFRDKRQQKLFETQRELESNKQEYQSTVVDLERLVDKIRREAKTTIDNLTRRAEEAEAKVAQLSQQQAKSVSFPSMNGHASSRFGLSVNTSGSMPVFASAPTPPEDYATDFTGTWRSGSGYQPLRPTVSNDSLNGMDMSRSSGDCGFCSSSNGYCPCRDAQAPVETTTTQPGTCSDCQLDPEKARQCRELARGSSTAQSGSSTAEGPRMYDSAASGPSARTSCSYVVHRARQEGMRNMPSITELFGERVRTFPGENGGFDIGVKEHEAATALHSLSRRNTMGSDGRP